MYFLDEPNGAPYAHDLDEMAQIGRVGNYTIWIYSGEDPTAHFHFIERQTRAEGCVCLLENRYFSHGRKQAELNAKERKLLIKFLCRPLTQAKGTVYNYLCETWNMNNPVHPLPPRAKMPDYTEILPYRR